MGCALWSLQHSACTRLRPCRPMTPSSSHASTPAKKNALIKKMVRPSVKPSVAMSVGIRNMQTNLTSVCIEHKSLIPNEGNYREGDKEYNKVEGRSCKM